MTDRLTQALQRVDVRCAEIRSLVNLDLEVEMLTGALPTGDLETTSHSPADVEVGDEPASTSGSPFTVVIWD